MQVVIFGTGGHGRELHRIIAECATYGAMWQVRGWLDDDPTLHGGALNGLPVLGGTDWFDTHSGHHVVVAVGNPRARRAVVARLRALGASFPTVIHPKAWVGGGVTLGEGCVLFPGAQVSTEIELGEHVHLNQGASVSHDSRLGAYATLAPGVRLAGNVTIGAGVDLFTGAVAIPGVTIGDGAVVGAGATVVSDLPADCTAVGVPARVVYRNTQRWNDG